MSAAGASEYHLNQLQMDSDVSDSSAITRADASVNPKQSTVSYWYRLWREANLGKRHGEGMWNVLETKVAEYLTVGERGFVTRFDCFLRSRNVGDECIARFVENKASPPGAS